MDSLVVTHTGLLEPAALAAGRRLLEQVFGDDLTSDDWEHCLGGMHALLWQDGELVAHAALVQRRLLHQGRVLRAGYVEGVAVRADLRRRGLGGVVMAPLEQAGLAAYDVVALSSTDDGAAFYQARGWQPWRGPTSALTPQGIVRTPDDDAAVHVRPSAVPLDLDGELTCDCREGDLW